MRLEISRRDLAAIMAEAAASPDREVCGLLLGKASRVDEVLSCINVADEPARAFEIDPAALIAAHRRARNGGPNVIGHYHSHPSGSTTPSSTDIAASHDDDKDVWVIVADNQMKAWLMSGPGSFLPVELQIVA